MKWISGLSLIICWNLPLRTEPCFNKCHSFACLLIKCLQHLRELDRDPMQKKKTFMITSTRERRKEHEDHLMLLHHVDELWRSGASLYKEPPSSWTHFTGWSVVSKPAYSPRMMSMARGGLSVQLGSILRLDPLFMLTAVLGFSQQTSSYLPETCLHPLGASKSTLSSPKGAPKLSTEGYRAPE